jgi:hypothetical protein
VHFLDGALFQTDSQKELRQAKSIPTRQKATKNHDAKQSLSVDAQWDKYGRNGEFLYYIHNKLCAFL